MAELKIDIESAAVGLKHDPADQVAIALGVRAAVHRYEDLSMDLHRALECAADPDYSFRISKDKPSKRFTSEDIADKFNGYAIPVPTELQACGSHWTPGMASYACGCILAYEEYILEVEQRGQL